MECRKCQHRYGYLELQDQLMESQLPWDEQAELNLIGALILAPKPYTSPIAKLVLTDHFYDPWNAWLWGRTVEALCVKNVAPESLPAWLQKMGGVAYCKREFWGAATRKLAACLQESFWWHARWYAERVKQAAEARAGVVRASEQLAASLGQAEAWRNQCSRYGTKPASSSPPHSSSTTPWINF